MKLALITFALFAMSYATVWGRVQNSSLDSLPAEVVRPALRDNPTTIFLKRGSVDTRVCRRLDTSASDVRKRLTVSSDASATGAVMRIVQLAGPVRPEWIRSIKSTGCSIVGYVPNYAYIVRGNVLQIGRLAELEKPGAEPSKHPVTWMAAVQPIWKMDPAFTREQLMHSTEPVSVEIEVTRDADVSAVESSISSLGVTVLADRKFAGVTVLSATTLIGQLGAVASLDDVLYIERERTPGLLDERADQIVAGNLSPDATQPSGPGYLSWLSSLGLDTPMDFAIDVSDSGLDRGSASAGSLHPDFLDASGQSRVSYIVNYADDGLLNDTRGHGTLVASIAAGYPNVGIEDPDGYALGTGVAPFATIGVSRIFDAMGRIQPQTDFSKITGAAYAAGARISNESWGQEGNEYDIAAQEFDALTRDCQANTEGNQEMTFVFAAGNSGPGGHIDSPGTAKNVISVGASENYRPDSFDTCNLDGQGSLGPDSSDNAQDLLRFSSGGPVFDGRTKPDLVAPGTHIYGARSQDPRYNAAGLCPGFPLYGPPTEAHFYVSSSGTSMATPYVSGAAALVRQYLSQHSMLGNGGVPSPAMIKAYLVNSTDYLSGEYAGGDLPGERQGWGLINLSRAFDNTPRKLVDQTELFTASGQTFQIDGSIADRTKPLRITLAWTDAPGTPLSAPWVNDLDLELTVGGSTVYLGNVFHGQFSAVGGSPDSQNNVECIFIPPDKIPAGSDGDFTITVRAANIAGDGVPGNGIDLDQDFALVVYNIAAPIPPPPQITSVTYSAKVLTISGSNFSSNASVSINGTPVDMQFSFDAQSNSLSLKAKPKKIHLIKRSTNQIVVVENGQSSRPYTLQL